MFMPIRSCLTRIINSNMAIIIQEQKKSINLFAITTVVIILFVILLSAYFLFFASQPVIEIIVPAPLETAAEIAKTQFDPAVIINSSEFRALRSYAGLPTVGSLGRTNPFISY